MAKGNKREVTWCFMPSQAVRLYQGSKRVREVLYKEELWCRQIIVQELCKSRGGRPGLSVLTSLLVSVDVKIYCTVLRHWSQLVPNMSTDI